MSTRADVVVAGAGPGGCASAIALARAGARVHLVGLLGDPARGLSGEWLHPAGVRAAAELGVCLSGPEVTRNLGFVVHPGTGREPVLLPYAEGTAVSMSHHALVERMRVAAAAAPGITVHSGHRVTEVDRTGAVLTSVGAFRADLVVGAEGRSSLVRRALRPQEAAGIPLSRTAGFELTGVRLPQEGYGHILLGGPGPVLAYRIGPDTVRLCLDVPPAADRALECLRERYAPVLPDGLRAALLSTNRVRWAANRFRRKHFYGLGRLALVGDAVGFGHPLAAHGMTLALLDAESLGRHGSVAAYARERRARSWTPERLGTALHRSFTDPGSTALRESLVHLWRHAPRTTGHMMRMLAVQETGRAGFGRTVAAIAAVALADTLRDGPRLRGTADLVRWLAWLLGEKPCQAPAIT